MSRRRLHCWHRTVRPIARKGANVDAPVDVGQLPDHVIQPFLAIEDRRFYDHWGVDPRGLARAAFSNATGGPVQGGSTITQQLAKFTFLTPERSMTRKAREMMIAFWLEAWLTKEEILERYLSNAYFGDNQYGLRAASLHYFYRQPENLKPAQAAMLAGLLQAPSAYAPTRHPERAKRRWLLVRQAMVDAGYITAAEADAMSPPALDVRAITEVPTGTYFADWALPQARAMTEMGYEKRTLTTTLDARLQRIASQVVRGAPLGGAQVALVAMRPNGEVVAMVGGKDYAKSAFNRVTQARRQPGSTFKLFVYLAALRNGWDPGDTIDNSAVTEGSYRPKNSRNAYSDTITLEQAFARSSNVAAVRLMQEVGSREVIETARDLGVSAPMEQGDPTLALGTAEMSLLELTAAYAGIAGNRFPVEPYAFAREESGWFARMVDGSDSLSASTHDELEAMLRGAVSGGNGGRPPGWSVPAFGKTGTTQDHRDALFVGYADDLVVGVWIGNDDNSPLGGISGGGLPARIWHDFMARALNVRGPAPTPAPLPDEQSDPGTPVEPLDVPFGDAFGNLRIGDGGVVVTTDIDGRPVEIGVDRNGVRVDSEQLEEARAASAGRRPTSP